MRFITSVAAAAVLLGAATGSAGTITARVPLRLQAVEASGGSVDLESAGEKGQLLGFVPHGHFELGLVLRNTSGVRLVVTNVRTVEPPRTLVHQTGGRFHHLQCSQASGCGFPMAEDGLPRNALNV